MFFFLPFGQSHCSFPAFQQTVKRSHECFLFRSNRHADIMPKWEYFCLVLAEFEVQQDRLGLWMASTVATHLSKPENPVVNTAQGIFQRNVELMSNPRKIPKPSRKSNVCGGHEGKVKSENTHTHTHFQTENVYRCSSIFAAFWCTYKS